MRKALAFTAAGITLGAGLLSVAATANAAPLAHRHQAGTTLTAAQSAGVINGRGSVTITGDLTEGSTALARETVTLETVNGRRTASDGTARTNRGGSVSFTVSPRSTTTYELVFSGTSSLAPATSSTLTVRVGR
jgi:hypothetical protein